MISNNQSHTFRIHSRHGFSEIPVKALQNITSDRNIIKHHSTTPGTAPSLDPPSHIPQPHLGPSRHPKHQCASHTRRQLTPCALARHRNKRRANSPGSQNLQLPVLSRSSGATGRFRAIGKTLADCCRRVRVVDQFVHEIHIPLCY